MTLVGNFHHRPYNKGYEISEEAWASALQNVGRNQLDPNIFYVANEAMLQDMPLHVHRLA